MQILLSQESAWSLAALLGLSAAAASACAAWFALGSAAAWQHQKTLTSSCSSCWLECHASTTSKLTQKKTLIIFHCTGVPSWWQAGWSALMTCPSPPVRVSSLPPVVARTSTSSMSDSIFKEGCWIPCHHCQYKTFCNSTVLMSIKQKENKIFTPAKELASTGWTQCLHLVYYKADRASAELG